MLGIWMNCFSIIIIFNVTGVHDQQNTAVVTVSQQIESQAKRQKLVDQQGKILPSHKTVIFRSLPVPSFFLQWINVFFISLG